MNRCKRLAVFIFPALFVSIPRADAAEDVLGAEALAMGGAAVASPQDNAGITLNPGVIALDRRYDFHGFFRYGSGAGLHWGGNVVDARTTPWLALGLSYSGDRWKGPLFPGETPGWTVPGMAPSNQKRTDDFALALAVPLLDRKLSIGLNGALSLYNHDRLGKGAWFNAGVGVAARPFDWLILGASARNVLPFDGLGDRPLQATGGLRLQDTSIGAVEVNVGWTDIEGREPWTLAVGAEKTLGSMAHLRAGFRQDGPLDRRDVTFGIGLGGGGGSLSWGIAVPIGPDQPTWAGLINQISITFQAPHPHEPVGF